MDDDPDDLDDLFEGLDGLGDPLPFTAF